MKRAIKICRIEAGLGEEAIGERECHCRIVSPLPRRQLKGTATDQI
jgi:hypothetical protein